jgi:hypothetical protein
MAEVKLKKGDVLKFFIGGAGGGSAVYDSVNNEFSKISEGYDKGKAGGKPNGGNGGTSFDNSSKGATPGASGGGGSTDVRLLKDGYGKTGGGKQGHNLGELGSTYSDVYDKTADKRILVAGGGGGAAQNTAQGPWNNWPGLTGGNPGESGKSTGSAEYTDLISGTPGGKGADGCNGGSGNGYEGSGGGGGGYIGGGAATFVESNKIVASGGGGSNFPSGPSDGISGDNTNFPSSDSDRSIKNLLTAEKDDKENDNYLSTFYGNGKATIKWIKAVDGAGSSVN